jgi:hypothetical protein
MARPTKRKDPLLTAAVLKVSFALRGSEAAVFREIYQGVLRDFDLKESDVDAYIEANRERVEKLARGEPDA